MTSPQRAFLLAQRCLNPSEVELRTAKQAFDLACTRLSQAGTPIQVLATSYLSAQERWLGLCLADTEATVRRAAETAQLMGVTVSEV